MISAIILPDLILASSENENDVSMSKSIIAHSTTRAIAIALISLANVYQERLLKINRKLEVNEYNVFDILMETGKNFQGHSKLLE